MQYLPKPKQIQATKSQKNKHAWKNPFSPKRMAADDCADKRGADELMQRCEWALADNPEALYEAREIYRRANRCLYRCLERQYKP